MNGIREDLKAFVDGELSPERMAEVQAAIDSDPALKQEAEYMRMLGFEIKKLAAEPAVAGKEAAVSKFRKPLAPWWDTSRLAGRLAYAGALFVVLAGTGAVLFPVFAQSKQASKRTAAMTAAKQEELRWQNQTADSGADVAADSGMQPMNGALSRGGGRPEFNYKSKPDSPMDMAGAGGSRTGFSGGAGEPAVNSPTGGGFVDGMVYGMSEVPSKTPSPSKPAETGKGRSTPIPRRVQSRNSQPTVDKQGTTSANIPNVPATNRMVVKNADISLKVDDAKKALTEAEQLAKSLGGYVEGGNLTSPPEGTPQSSAVLRVPSKLYETAMKALRGMGEVLSETSNAQDVTAQYADTQGRLSVLTAEADSYVTMLRGAKKIGELMEIKDRLSQVRQEIASLKSQAKALQNESSLSTIRAEFQQKETIEKEEEKEKSGFDETWAKAVNGLSAVGSFLGNLAIYLFVFSPIWLPPVILFWWLGKKAKA